MLRRTALKLTLAGSLPFAQAQPIVQGSPVDSVALYVIPTDGVPEQFASNVARALTKDTGLWVKATGKVPSEGVEPFPGINQYPAEDYLPLGVRTSKQLQDTSARTYYIVLTDRDINSKSQNFRFQYSFHGPMIRTSVLSVARLFYERDGTIAPEDVVATRVQKMLMRIVGEMRLGWKRSNDPTDLMFSPIMSIDDIDRMSLIHTIRRHNQ